MTTAGDTDRTTQGLIDALSQVPTLDRQPGTEYAYSGASYVCLAMVVQRAAGQLLPDFARRHLFGPLQMADTCYWPGPGPTPPRAAPLASAHPAPLSLGDGGVWSTAADLLRWGQALNTDWLGICGLLQTPGRLDDGTLLDYAWGMGVRSHAGHRVYRHGGGWPGVRALLARVPDLGLSLVIVALADDTERTEEFWGQATAAEVLPFWARSPPWLVMPGRLVSACTAGSACSGLHRKTTSS